MPMPTQQERQNIQDNECETLREVAMRLERLHFVLLFLTAGRVAVGGSPTLKMAILRRGWRQSIPLGHILHCPAANGGDTTMRLWLQQVASRWQQPVVSPDMSQKTPQRRAVSWKKLEKQREDAHITYSPGQK